MKNKLFAIAISALLLLAFAGCEESLPSNPGGVSNPSSSSSSGEMGVSGEQAGQIALDHAGLTAAGVTGLKAELDRDDGVTKYEVEFRVGTDEYAYDIKAEDGSVLKAEKNDRDLLTTQTPQPQPPAGLKTADEAKAAALNHAGFTADGVTGLKAELDRDDGVTKYEVEFRVGTDEYAYDIKADDGTILKAEKNDRDLLQVNTAGLKTAEEAKSIALADAGLTAQSVGQLKVELDTEGSAAVYEVEFKAGGYEYDYEIDAKTGQILKREKERDD